MKKHEAYYSQSRPEMRCRIPQGVNSVLDVGCGAGSFGAALREDHPDWKICGVELFEDEAARAREHYNEVWAGDVHVILDQIQGRTFDVIVFNDLLEHLVDPGRALTQCRTLLAPGGHVLASIPNMRFWPALSDLLFQADWRYRDAGVMDSTHLRFFTKRSMIRMFESTGYRVDAIDGINKTWIRSIRWMLCNAVLGGQMQDCLFPQFAITATPQSA
jgi:2-polyprenyl-3-methyl-5-hydroxy-6-metoxy-1,4-benzoquinol methylase